MRLYFDNVGSVGIAKDIPPHKAPQEAWTDGANIDFIDNKVKKSKGYCNVFDSSTASPSIAITPYSLRFHKVGSNDYWAYAGLNKIYATDGTTHADVTNAGGDYSAAAAIPWTGGNLGGIAIMNNGVNMPQQWGDTATAASLTKAFQNLENWSSTASVTCRFIRPFKEFLIAGDITKGGVRNEREIRWSHPAEPGTVPDSWDFNDSTKDAGQYELAQTSDALIDSMPLRDTNVLYKQYSTWGMQFIGNPNIFRFFNIFENIGALSVNCSQPFFGRHFLFGNDDVIIHDGQNHERPFNKRLTREIFSAISPDNFHNCFVAPNYTTNEMWLCYPETGDTFATKAVVWNWKDNTVSIRELPGASSMELGLADPANDTWAADTNLYSLDSSKWDQAAYNPTIRRLLMTVPGATDRIHMFDESEQKNGTNMTSFIEREALPLGRVMQDGRIKFNNESYKFVRNIYPELEGTEGGVIRIYVGTQNYIDGPKTWEGPFLYTIGTDYKIDCRVNGRIISIKFESTTDITWTLAGFSVDFDLEGER